MKMNCQQVRELLPAFVDGALPERQMQGVRGALQGCPDCVELLAQLRALDAAAATLPRPQVSAEFDDAFWARLRVETRPAASPHTSWWRRFWTPLALFAGVAVMMVFALRVPLGDGTRGAEAPPPALTQRLDLLRDLPVVEHLEALEMIEVDDDLDMLLTMDELLTDEVLQRGGQ